MKKDISLYEYIIGARKNYTAFIICMVLALLAAYYFTIIRPSYFEAKIIVSHRDTTLEDKINFSTLKTIVKYLPAEYEEHLNPVLQTMSDSNQYNRYLSQLKDPKNIVGYISTSKLVNSKKEEDAYNFYRGNIIVEEITKLNKLKQFELQNKFELIIKSDNKDKILSFLNIALKSTNRLIIKDTNLIIDNYLKNLKIVSDSFNYTLKGDSEFESQRKIEILKEAIKLARTAQIELPYIVDEEYTGSISEESMFLLGYKLLETQLELFVNRDFNVFNKYLDVDRTLELVTPVLNNFEIRKESSTTSIVNYSLNTVEFNEIYKKNNIYLIASISGFVIFIFMSFFQQVWAREKEEFEKEVV